MKRFFVIMVLGVLLVAGPVQAQDALSLSSLEISLWPEFDRPEVLVIYRGTFPSDTPTPVPVEIRIPARVGQPTAVAYVEGGDRLNQQYTTRIEDDWLIVSFELATTAFQLEYYDTLPVDAAGNRTYTYDLTADYPIAALSMEFQVPPTAQGFMLDPEADSVLEQADGLTYHLVQAGSIEQGESKRWTFAYQKGNDELTASAFEQLEAPVPTLPAESGDSSTALIFLIAFVALVAVGASAFWLGRRTHVDSEPAAPAAARRKRRGKGRGEEVQRQPRTSLGAEERRFCHKCGAQIRPDSEFCHKCGVLVRGE